MLEPAFPQDLPERLKRSAVLQGSEAAWALPEALEVIDWCGANALAVVGTELWIVEDGRALQAGVQTTSGLRQYEYDTEPRPEEAWEHFQARSIREARAALEGFAWPEDALDAERVPYFYLLLVDELWVQQYLHNQEPGLWDR